MRFTACLIGLVVLGCAPTGVPRASRQVSGGDGGLRAFGAPGPGGSGGITDAGECASVQVGARRVVPTVTLVVDQSGSMDEDLSRHLSRWDAMRDALIADDGLVTALESQVEFGLALFSDESGGSRSCPQITEVPAMAMNRAAIADVYRRARPLGETPTGDALEQLIDALPTSLDATDDPHIFILATDGNPDRCGAPDGHDSRSRAQSVAAVEHAFTAGVRTYALGVGLGTVSADHLRELALAGSGGASAEYWEAGDAQGLREALEAIVRNELSCVLELEGNVSPEAACSGNVELNGDPLPCADPNGWRLNDATHIEVMGTACDRLLQGNATVSASFPCQAIII